MRKMGSCDLVELLTKKSCIPIFQPKLLLIAEWYFFFQSYEENDFEPTKV